MFFFSQFGDQIICATSFLRPCNLVIIVLGYRLQDCEFKNPRPYDGQSYNSTLTPSTIQAGICEERIVYMSKGVLIYCIYSFSPTTFETLTHINPIYILQKWQKRGRVEYFIYQRQLFKLFSWPKEIQNIGSTVGRLSPALEEITCGITIGRTIEV